MQVRRQVEGRVLLAKSVLLAKLTQPNDLRNIATAGQRPKINRFDVASTAGLAYLEADALR